MMAGTCTGNKYIICGGQMVCEQSQNAARTLAGRSYILDQV